MPRVAGAGERAVQAIASARGEGVAGGAGTGMAGTETEAGEGAWSEAGALGKVTEEVEPEMG